jgi:hypothetical protein
MDGTEWRPSRRWTVRGSTRLVDSDGLVWCAEREHDVPIDTCLGCARLRTVVREGDRITEISCAVEAPAPVVISPWELTLGPQR